MESGDAKQRTRAIFDQTIAVDRRAEAGSTRPCSATCPTTTLRAEIDNFDGSKTSRGVFILKYVLQGHAAYRTQLFLYLKSCGRDELNTRNLWSGVDAPATV